VVAEVGVGVGLIGDVIGGDNVMDGGGVVGVVGGDVVVGGGGSVVVGDGKGATGVVT
jgi:hypothetical protein